jgi:hypothetical protein
MQGIITIFHQRTLTIKSKWEGEGDENMMISS